MDLQLIGKNALIMGASRGLGFATSQSLAIEGANVAINSRSENNLHQAAEKIRQVSTSQVLVLPGDIASPEVPGMLVQKTYEHFGGLDILITNSGGPPSGSFESFTDQDWVRSFELVLMSHVRTIRAALPYLRRSAAASVLAITSYSVKQPIPNLILSNSLRAATAGMIKSLAVELGSEGIRFNSILPGWTETERVTELINARSKTKGTDPDVELQQQTSEIPLGRMGAPTEFANAAVFLVSPAAAYITGVMLNVDGGIVKGLF